MRRAKQKRHGGGDDVDESNWVVKPLTETLKHPPLVDVVEQQQQQQQQEVPETETKTKTETVLYFKPLRKTKPRWASQTRGAHLAKPTFGTSSSDVGGEIGSGCGLDEGDVEVDQHQRPERSSNRGKGKSKWASSNRGAHLGKPTFGTSSDVGGSNFEEIGSGCGLDEVDEHQKSSNWRKSKWGSRNRGAHLGKPTFGSSSDVGGSSFGEIGSGCGLDEGEVELKSGKGSNFDVGGSGGSGSGQGLDEEGEIELKEKDDVVEVDEVVNRLEKLYVGVEEVELTQELIQINDQAQEDELLVMESIYGGNVRVLEKQQDLRLFQIHIHIELPNEFPISAKLKTPSHSSSRVDDSDFSYTFKVQYLSPIVLTCLLPRSYPSHYPPSFTISVQWLHESRISELCSMLDSLWNELPGQEILYQWVEWLHGSSLPYLGFSEELVLGPYGVKNDYDKRVVSVCVSPDIDIPLMKSYDKERQHEDFLSNCHECCICFSEYAGSEFMKLPCHHFFCAKCMKTYAVVHIKEGTVNKLQCPTTKCGGMIPPSLLKRLLGDEEFDRWESLMLQKTLDAMSDVAYCPRCETGCLEDEDHHAQCSKCFYSFCALCKDRRHVGIECMTPEMKLKILEGRQNSSNLNSNQRDKEREMINELLSVKQILRDAKQCPSCKMAISRIEGCNKMVCGHCGKYFCYLCNQAIDGYDHFRDGGCELFPQEAIDQWEERVNDRQRVGQAQAILFGAGGNGRPCPNCRQLNAKMGNNNHIFCWACQNHFCYLCRKVVRRSSEHFGPKGCKQHSAD